MKETSVSWTRGLVAGAVLLGLSGLVVADSSTSVGLFGASSASASGAAAGSAGGLLGLGLG